MQGPLIDCAFACVQSDGSIYCFPITNASNYNITFTCSFQHDNDSFIHLKRVFFVPLLKWRFFHISNGGWNIASWTEAMSSQCKVTLLKLTSVVVFVTFCSFFLWENGIVITFTFLLVIEFRQVASRLRMDFYVGLVGVVNAQASLLSIFNLFTSCHAHLGVHIWLGRNFFEDLNVDDPKALYDRLYILAHLACNLCLIIYIHLNIQLTSLLKKAYFLCCIKLSFCYIISLCSY